MENDWYYTVIFRGALRIHATFCLSLKRLFS